MHLKTAWSGLCVVWRMMEGGWLTGIFTPGGMGTGHRFVWGLLDCEPSRDLSCLLGASARCWNQDHCLLGDSASPLFFPFLCLSSPLRECCSASSVSLQVSMVERRRCCSAPAYLTTPSRHLTYDTHALTSDIIGYTSALPLQIK